MGIWASAILVILVIIVIIVIIIINQYPSHHKMFTIASVNNQQLSVAWMI